MVIFPVLAKINAYDGMRRGMRLGEALEVARLLEESGCSAIEVSSGTVAEGLSIMRGPELPVEALLAANFRVMKMPAAVKQLLAGLLPVLAPSSPKPYRNYNVEAARAIRKQVSIPVIAVGGIHTLTDVGSAIGSGAADFVSMSRPFIIEPDILRKLQEGRQQGSRCIMCNYCAIMIETDPLRCWHGKLPVNLFPERRGVADIRENQLSSQP